MAKKIARTTLLWLLILGGSFMLRAPALFVDIYLVDEAEHAIMANVINSGGLPYKHSVEMKPPLLYYFYAGIFKLAGPLNMQAVHLFMILWFWLLSFVMYLLGAEIFNRRTGIAAALLMAVFSPLFLGKDVLSANTENFMILPITISFYLFCHAEKRAILSCYFLAGAMAALATLFKHQAGINLVAFLVYLVLVKPLCLRKIAWDQLFTQMILVSSGFALPILWVVAGSWFHGNLDTMYEWAWDYNFRYIAGGAEDWLYLIYKFTVRTLIFASGGFVIWYLALRGAIRKLVRFTHERFHFREDIPARIHTLILVWFAFNFIPILWGGRFFFHYYIQLFPPLMLLAGREWDYLGGWQWLRTSQKKILAVSLLTLPGLVLYPTANIHRITQQPNIYQRLGETVQTMTDQNDAIFVWGYAPEIYFYSQRQPASRFLIPQFYTGKFPGTAGMYASQQDLQRLSSWAKLKNDFRPIPLNFQPYSSARAIHPRAWEFLMDDLNTFFPQLIVDTTNSTIRPEHREYTQDYPLIQAFIDRYYTAAGVVEGCTLYLRKSQAKPIWEQEIVQENG